METYPNLGGLTVEQAQPAARAAFIRRTYLHLALAIIAFVGLEALLLNSPFADLMIRFLKNGGQMGWLMILGAFVVTGWLARGLAARAPSLGAQYAGLAIYVAAEAVIFVPILLIAHAYHPGVITQAAFITAGLFAGLTLVAFTSRTDFSFLGGFLALGGMIAVGAILGGVFFGFNLGLGFSIIMLVVAAGAILYDTGKIMRYYPVDRHVGAALELFASVALMFWYVLRILMRRR